jgi:hypothetical protein
VWFGESGLSGNRWGTELQPIDRPLVPNVLSSNAVISLQSENALTLGRWKWCPELHFDFDEDERLVA